MSFESAEKTLAHRIARIDKAILDQRAYLHRVPDPDTRYRAESNLFRLVAMSEEARRRCGPDGTDVARPI